MAVVMATAPPSFNVVLLGGPRQGKTTFIRKLKSLDSKVEHTPANLNAEYTPTVAIDRHTVYFSTASYRLVSRLDSPQIHVPHDDKTIFDSFARNINLVVRPTNPAEVIKLNLIDTPGLSDNDEEAAEHFRKLLSFLMRQGAAHGQLPGTLSAILFFTDSRSEFSGPFQYVHRYYEKFMQEVFPTAAVINTGFSVERWESLYREHETHPGSPRFLPSYQRSVKMRYMLKRHEDFVQTFHKSSHHFFIDSAPQSKYAFEELMTHESLSEIVQFIMAQKVVSLNTISVPKLDMWRSVDVILIRGWHTLLQIFEKDNQLWLKAIQDANSAQEIARSSVNSLAEEIEELERLITRSKRDDPLTFNRANRLTLNRAKTLMEKQRSSWSCIQNALSNNFLVVSERQGEFDAQKALIKECKSRVALLKSDKLSLADKASITSLDSYKSSGINKVEQLREYITGMKMYENERDAGYILSTYDKIYPPAQELKGDGGIQVNNKSPAADQHAAANQVPNVDRIHDSKQTRTPSKSPVPHQSPPANQSLPIHQGPNHRQSLEIAENVQRMPNRQAT